MFKDGRNSIQGVGRPKMVGTPEIVNSVSVLILAGRRIIIETFLNREFLWVVTIDKMVYDKLAFSGIHQDSCK